MRKKTLPEGKVLSICFINSLCFRRLGKRLFEVASEVPIVGHAQESFETPFLQGHYVEFYGEFQTPVS
jgi:hypothetical protein